MSFISSALAQLAPLLRPSSTPQEEDSTQERICIGDRTFVVLKVLAEGGFALVYLVQELPPTGLKLASSSRCGSGGGVFALKQVPVGSHEQLLAAQREIAALRRLAHPNVVSLLDFRIDTPAAGVRRGRVWSAQPLHAHLLFPFYEAGSLWELVQDGLERGQPLPLLEVLGIFLQVCAALQAMHALQLAHRDVKPLNILLQRRQGLGGASGGAAPHGSLGEFHAVLADFGSARPARIEIRSPLDASAVREDAEAHCSPAYCAPELAHVPCPGALDERVDVWSAGCLLYFMLAGQPPYEAAPTAGGAEAAGADVRWPPPQRPDCPPVLGELVALCLKTDPSARPFIAEVLEAAEALAQQLASGP